MKSLSLSLTLLATPALALDPSDIAKTYSDIALANYQDSLTEAQALLASVETLVDAPTQDNLTAARKAWVQARVPYQQTEVFRFGNPIVDEWEVRVNAWPLDEGLIDYVENESAANIENPYAAANVIAHTSIDISGSPLNAEEITPELIRSLNEFDGIEANVASGYHAIEFLLWGQDLNGTNAGAGTRPASDFDQENCTHENCDRRAAYLVAASQLLVDDLTEMTANWEEGGSARDAVKNGDVFQIAFTGLGSLSYGELAGQRMKLGLMLHDPEEEHDCFSDNTIESIYYDIKGMENIWLGSYERVDGTVVNGASLQDYVQDRDPTIAQALTDGISASLAAAQKMRDAQATGIAYDQMLAAGNTEGSALIEATIDALIAQTSDIERAAVIAESGEIVIEGSDSLDDPNAVFQ